MQQALGPGAEGARYDRLDLLRAAAMLWMAAYHFCFDLQLFGLIRQDFNHDPFWTVQRTCIVGLFLWCAGAGQAIAVARGQPWRRFWMRWGQIAVCALIVTIASWWMFPRSYIYFGVLHAMAVMLPLARLTQGLGPWLWPAGAVAILAPHWWAAPVFDHAWLHWIGLMTYKPVTEDYVPLLPWLGVLWWGVACGQWMQARRPLAWVAPVHGPARHLVWLGQWPLSFYMLHQPILIGLLLATVNLARG